MNQNNPSKISIKKIAMRRILDQQFIFEISKGDILATYRIPIGHLGHPDG